MVRVKTTEFKSNLQERVREHIERESASNDLVGPQSPTSLLSVEEMSAAVVGKVMQELDTVSPAGTRDGTWASKSEIDHLASKFSGLENEIRSVHALLRSGGGPDASAVFMEKLEAFVETPGALRYTPRADDTGANDTFVSVRKAAGGHDAVVEALRAEIVGVFRDWADDPDDFKPFDATWRGNNLVDLYPTRAEFSKREFASVSDRHDRRGIQARYRAGFEPDDRGCHR